MAPKITDRPSFRREAERLKQPGTDLAHRTSWEMIRDDVMKHRAGTLSSQQYADIHHSIGGASYPYQTELADFVGNPQDDAKARKHLTGTNSAPENLRPGDPGRNRRIKGNFDPGWVPSANRPREGSLSPISKRQVVARLDNGQDVPFFAPGGQILSSAHPGPIPPREVYDSLAAHVQNSSFGYGQSGNKITFKP
jgi:hypothetical protein